MNRHGLEVLGFSTALELVAGFASSELGSSAVRSLEPRPALTWADAQLRSVEEMMNFILRSDGWAPPAIPDLRAGLTRLGVEGSVLEGPELAAAAVLLESAREARRSVLRFAEDHPRLAEVAGVLVKLEKELERLRRALDERGDVRDDASRELGSLRREIRGARGRIVARLDQFVASLPERIRVADASVSVRDGRYVVPIRREGRSEVGGIVHDESATGQTLFVEPQVAIELLNRLRELELAEAREVQRILRELTALLRPHGLELSATLDALVDLDSLFARAGYALRHDARRPELLESGAREYRVVRGAHPGLLAGEEPVVPFDLWLEPGERTLLVSGPNTGGKTVLLKAVGLISALAQAGVVPPVGPDSRLPLFSEIYADIGDEQSIEASLSTFSAHLRNLREVLAGADERALVLVDEIGSGTDPSEGAALARAILVELTARGALTIATTHLGSLKLLAGEVPGVVNASLQFDPVGLRPTYRLTKGVPGRSYGLAIARRLGFPDELLERAEGFRDPEEREAGQLLAELEEKERSASAELATARAERARAAELRAALERRERELSERERDAERGARQQARDLLLSAREEVEEVVRELRARARSAKDEVELEEAARTARGRVERAATRHAERPPAGRDTSSRGAPDAAVGARVRIRSTGAAGRVVELRDGRALVEAGGVRLHVPAEELEPLPADPAAAGASRGRPAAGSSGWSGDEVEPASEVDLRGLRAEEVAGMLEPALDAAIFADLPALRVIHGKGEGVLREVVREIVEADRRVRSFRPGGVGEGGAGVTVVELE